VYHAGVSRSGRAAPRVFVWARHTSWALLGTGFLLLVVNAVWQSGWGPTAVGLLIGGYAAGVVAVLPIVSRTVRAFCEVLTAFLPRPLAAGVATAVLAGATCLMAWAWVAGPW
jgi:hypothetical protein